MSLVVGYDQHPISRAAMLFASELAAALDEAVHVVHIVDTPDKPISGAPISTGAGSHEKASAERQHVKAALDAARVQWTYRVLNGDPVTALLRTADECSARSIVISGCQDEGDPSVDRILAADFMRNLLSRSSFPVVLVPGMGAKL